MLVVPGPLITAQGIATVAGTAARRAFTAAIEHDALTGGSYVLNVWYCIRVALTPYHCSQNFARIDFKLISRPQYPLPKLSPPFVVTADYEQLLPTIWMV